MLCMLTFLGIGFGLIYLPAVICVGYYFEAKRALATGIAVCGSGVGTFAFAPFSAWMLTVTDWRTANLILAAILLSCAVNTKVNFCHLFVEKIYHDYTFVCSFLDFS